MFATSFFPTGTVNTIKTGITTAITDNIFVIVGLIAFTSGIALVFSLFNRHTTPAVISGYDGWQASYRSGRASGLSSTEASEYADSHKAGNKSYWNNGKG